MKAFIVISLFIAGSFVNISARAQSTDPVSQAEKLNKIASGKTSDKTFEASADFLVKSADARMMDNMEGTLAAKKGSTAAVRNYGMLMMKDQTMLLKKIKALAAARKISLPGGISNKKESAREDLSKKTGEDFDKGFIKMMRIDHERDVKIFEQAIGSQDKGISQFASSYLPMIQSHLVKIKELENKQG